MELPHSRSGTIHFTSADVLAAAGTGLPATYPFVAGDNSVIFTNGVTLKTAGSRTVTATSTIIGTTNPITVSPTSATTLSVVASSGTTTVGRPLSVTVTARDQYGNTVTGYVGGVHFTSTDGAASLPGNYAFVAGDNGTHTFSTKRSGHYLRPISSPHREQGHSVVKKVVATPQPDRAQRCKSRCCPQVSPAPGSPPRQGWSTGAPSIPPGARIRIMFARTVRRRLARNGKANVEALVERLLAVLVDQLCEATRNTVLSAVEP